MTRRAMTNLRTMAAVSLVAFCVALGPISGCAPQLEKKALDAPAETKASRGWPLQHDEPRDYLTTEKNADGTFVTITTREFMDGSKEMRVKENEKYGKKVAQGAKIENEEMDKLSEHAWWGERQRKNLETRDPWHL